MNTKTCNILTNELRPSCSKSWSNIRIQTSVVSISIYNSGTRKTKRIKHKKKVKQENRKFYHYMHRHMYRLYMHTYACV